MSKTCFFFQFLGRTRLCFTDQETQQENVLGGPTPFWVSSYTSYLLYKVQDPFSACRQSQGQNIFFQFLGRTSLCFTDQETQEENVLGGPTPFWVSSYTSYLLYKVQDPFSPCRQSHDKNIFSIFREDQSLLHRPKNSGRECARWTNSLLGQVLHQLSPVQSSRSIQTMQTVPWPKHFFLLNFFRGPVFASQTKKLRKRMCLMDQLPIGSVLTPAVSCTKFKIHLAHADSPMAKTLVVFFSIFREDQSLLHRPRNSGRECAWWTNSLVGQFLHQLSPVQSSRSIQTMQTVPCPKLAFFFQFLGRTRLCFTDQETQQENVLGGPTPFWVSSYTSYLLYKVQDPFSACRQSQGQNIFFQFLGRTSLCFTDQETQEENVLGGPTPFWVSSYTSYLLYKVQDPFSPCRQSHDKNIFFNF